MIRLIRKDGMEILLNCDQINACRELSSGGCEIVLCDGEIIKVKNRESDIVEKTRACVQGIQAEKKSRT